MAKEIKRNMEPPKNADILEIHRLVLKAGREVIEELDAKYNIDPNNHPLSFLNDMTDKTGGIKGLSERTPEEIRQLSETTRDPFLEAQVTKKTFMKGHKDKAEEVEE
jgi:hypothetical protein